VSSGVLSRIVDLRPGERRAFVGAFVVLLLTVAAHTLLETARDTLFLSELPPRMLTWVYVSVALASLLVVPLSSRLSRAAGVRTGLVVSLLVTSFVASWFRIRPPTPALVFSLYVLGTLSATLLIGQFWMLAAALFSPAEGRRLFGPLAAGGVLGAVIGAGAASFLLAVAPVRVLLGGAALLYFAAALVTTTIDVEARTPEGEGTTAALGKGLPELRRHPFVLRLASITALSVVASVVIDFLFKAQVSNEIKGADLGAFFARYQLILNAASLVLQLFVSGPLVQRVGVVGLALLAPALLAVCGVAVALSGTAFAFVVVLKATDTAVRNSLGRVATELLWAPVENPTRVRGAVDVVVTRGAQALAGAVLFAAGTRLELTPQILTGAVCALLAFWLVVGAGIRAPYIELFRRALQRDSFERDFKLGELDLTSVETLVEALSRPEPSEVIAAINVLAERGRTRLIPALLLYHHDEEVLVRALQLFGPSGRTDWHALGERALDHPSPRVQQAAVRAFALGGVDSVLAKVKEHPSPIVRAFAALYASQRGGRALDGDPLSWEIFHGDDVNHSLKLAFIELLAAHPTPDATRILLGFAKLPALSSAATEALSKVGDASSVPFLIGRLRVAEDRVAARNGLLRLGTPAFEALSAALSDPSLERRTRVHVPRSVSVFKNAEAIDILLSVLGNEEDGLVRYKALRGLQEIALGTSLRIDTSVVLREILRNSAEYLRLFSLHFVIGSDLGGKPRSAVKIVLELLEDKIGQSRDRLARLLQVAHRGDDIPAIFSALDSDDRRMRGRAIEFLDALIREFGRSSDEVAELLRLVVDDLSPAERARRAAEFVGSFPDAHAALSHLSEDEDEIVREISMRAFAGLGAPSSTAASLIALKEHLV
jgi:AAA family ATP:ADP antiporter